MALFWVDMCLYIYYLQHRLFEPLVFFFVESGQSLFTLQLVSGKSGLIPATEGFSGGWVFRLKSGVNVVLKEEGRYVRY